MRGTEHIPWLYDSMMCLIERAGFGHLREWLTDGVSGRVLEIGCGTGRNLTRYSAAAGVVAFDPDLALVLVARRRAPRTQLLVGDAQSLPFREDAFDVVISGLVLCSVDDPAAAVAEIARVGGALRALEHVRAESRFQAWLQDRIQPAWTWFTGGCHPNRDTERTLSETFVFQERHARGTLRQIAATRQPREIHPSL